MAPHSGRVAQPRTHRHRTPSSRSLTRCRGPSRSAEPAGQENAARVAWRALGELLGEPGSKRSDETVVPISLRRDGKPEVWARSSPNAGGRGRRWGSVGAAGPKLPNRQPIVTLEATPTRAGAVPGLPVNVAGWRGTSHRVGSTQSGNRQVSGSQRGLGRVHHRGTRRRAAERALKLWPRGYSIRMASEPLLLPACEARHKIVLGYHGTTFERAMRIVNAQQFEPSTGPGEWLGHGVYFWEECEAHAWDWVARKYPGGTVLRANIVLGQCLDLADPAGLRLVVEAQKRLVHHHAQQGTTVPQNCGDDRQLDCAVANLAARETYPEVHAIRAVFEAGDPIYAGSGLRERSHVQICVRRIENIIPEISVVPKPEEAK